jgi:hypothetical protein
MNCGLRRFRAYGLMPNHFHRVVETPEANLVAGMAWLLSTYTIRLNARHKLSGHVFGGRYKALAVEAVATAIFENRVRLCASESGAGGPAEGGGSPGGLSVEQLGMVWGRARASARLAAGGSAAGGQRRRVLPIREEGNGGGRWRVR